MRNVWNAFLQSLEDEKCVSQIVVTDLKTGDLKSFLSHGCAFSGVFENLFISPHFRQLIKTKHFVCVKRKEEKYVLRDLTYSCGEEKNRSLINLKKWFTDYKYLLRQIEEKMKTLERRLKVHSSLVYKPYACENLLYKDVSKEKPFHITNYLIYFNRLKERSGTTDIHRFEKSSIHWNSKPYNPNTNGYSLLYEITLVPNYKETICDLECSIQKWKTIVKKMDIEVIK